MRLAVDVTQIHTVQENLYNGSIRQQQAEGWDFSHVHETLLSTLQKNPNYDLYLHCSREGCYDQFALNVAEPAAQAPYVVGILIESGQIPSSWVAYTDNQASKETILRFDDPSVKFRWEQLSHREYKGRVRILRCDMDVTLVPSTTSLDYHLHGYLNIFSITPSDLERNARGELKVNDVTYYVDDQDDGHELALRFDRRDESLREHLDCQLEAVYDIDEDSDPEARDEAEAKLRNAMALAVAQQRQDREAKISTFFNDRETPLTQEDFGSMRTIKIYPLDFTRATSRQVSRFFNPFPTTVVAFRADSSSPLLPGSHREGLLRAIRSLLVRAHHERCGQRAEVAVAEKQKEFEVVDVHIPLLGLAIKKANIFPPGPILRNVKSFLSPRGHPLVHPQGQGALLSNCRERGLIKSKFTRPLELYLVDLLLKTGYVELLPEDPMNIFGLTRILQHIGLLESVNPMDLGTVHGYVRDAVESLRRNVRNKGRYPRSVLDYALRFLFPNAEHQQPDLPPNSSATHLRLGGHLRKQPEVSSDGVSFSPIRTESLLEHITAEAAVPLIIELCLSKDNLVPIPAGARDADSDKENRPDRVDCFKQCLLRAPDRILSPEGKLRAKLSMPGNREVSFTEVNGYVQESIRTIAVKEEKINPHEVAMSSKNVMIGQFCEGTRIHSVIIDGEKGTIEDPVESYGTVKRSTEGLEQLGIRQFHAVTTITRQEKEMSDKKRFKLQKQLDLPFVKGSAKNWEK